MARTRQAVPAEPVGATAAQQILSLPSVQKLLFGGPGSGVIPDEVLRGRGAPGIGVPNAQLPPTTREDEREPVFPVGVPYPPYNEQLAPQPLVDRWPTVVGGDLTFQYVSTVARLCTTGYRQQAVDLWRELLEQDLHLGSVLTKRILQVANGRLEVQAAELSEKDPDYDLANRVRDLVEREVRRIPDLTSALVNLLWAIYYGCSAAEIIWDRQPDGWHVERLEFVHTRRLAWPDMQSWDAYIWDQGQVFGWNTPWGATPTNRGVFGLRLADFPGKFVFFAPQLFGDYPTRDGLARSVAMWAAFKRSGVRGAIDYLERFAKGYLDIAYTTQQGGDPRAATKEDAGMAMRLAHVLGPGNGRTAVHPDSIEITPKSFEGSGSGKSKITWAEWVQICNAEISKLVLGGTLGTEVGSGGGNRALGEVQERGEADLEQFDATCLGECLTRQLVKWIVRLNMPEGLRVLPRVVIDIEVEPDAKSVTENAYRLVQMGAPLDAEDVAQKAGFKLVPNEDKDAKGKPKARRLFLSDVVDPHTVNPSLMSEEAKQQAQDDKDAQNEVALQKAKQPVVAPGAAVPGKGPAPAAGKAAKPSSKVRPVASAKKDQRAGKAALKFLLSSRRPDKAAAGEVYAELLEDYPASSLDWILSGHWEGPQDVPVEDIDFSEQDSWRASHEDVTPYARRIEQGRRKPVILVKTPGNPKYVIVDGHHRTLASKSLGIPVLAYVAEVHVNRGPWLELHDLQKKGSSKTGDEAASYLPSRREAAG